MRGFELLPEVLALKGSAPYLYTAQPPYAGPSVSSYHVTIIMAGRLADHLEHIYVWWDQLYSPCEGRVRLGRKRRNALITTPPGYPERISCRHAPSHLKTNLVEGALRRTLVVYFPSRLSGERDDSR